MVEGIDPRLLEEIPERNPPIDYNRQLVDEVMLLRKEKRMLNCQLRSLRNYYGKDTGDHQDSGHDCRDDRDSLPREGDGED